jgi:hypothetical protein
MHLYNLSSDEFPPNAWADRISPDVDIALCIDLPEGTQRLFLILFIILAV